VLIEERERDDNFLTSEDIEKILDKSNGAEGDFRRGIVGYPSYPLYKQIAVMLQSWMETEWVNFSFNFANFH
jgi:hypothetical protein